MAILDMRMPGISGIETAQGLYNLGVPSMFLTAFNDQALVDQAITDGAMGYMLKPIDVDRAIPTIESAISRSRDIKELKDIKQRLESAIDASNLVNVVVGILMERHRLDRHKAYELLRHKARNERSKVTQVAEDILAGWDIFNQLTEKT
jgi:AmiR/NasT family two-component response regulator